MTLTSLHCTALQCADIGVVPQVFLTSAKLSSDLASKRGLERILDELNNFLAQYANLLISSHNSQFYFYYTHILYTCTCTCTCITFLSAVLQGSVIYDI